MSPPPWKGGYPHREDNIFPVPLLELGKAPRSGPPEARLAWQRTERINDCLASLNWLAGTRSEATEPGDLACEIHEYVGQCVDERPVPLDLITPDDAAKTVLRAPAGYEAEPGPSGPAAFDPHLVSLPPSMTDVPFADELGCTEVSSFLENFVFVQCELRSAAAYERMANDGLAASLHGCHSGHQAKVVCEVRQ